MEFNETTTQKAKALYEFIYDASHESYTVFAKKYPEYIEWTANQDKKYSYAPIQNRPGIMDYIIEKYF